jgi:hypothetical protein
MQEKKHQLSKYQLSVIEKVKKSKESEDKGNFLILEQSKQKFIFESDITPTSKLLLIYFLSKIDFCHRHLYIHASYAIITKETTIIKSTIMRSVKELQEKGLIKLLSGKNRAENTLIKEFIFNQKQYIQENQNQTNIVEMTPFFEQFFKGAK